jgi:hypothetical protein
MIPHPPKNIVGLFVVCILVTFFTVILVVVVSVVSVEEPKNKTLCEKKTIEGVECVFCSTLYLNNIGLSCNWK